MTYKYNPKTKDSGIICCIPQTGTCPNNCPDCFFQNGRSYLEPLSKNLPNMPSLKQVGHRVVRVNDGNDSNYARKKVVERTQYFQNKFYNTSDPVRMEDFPGPVVLTLNPTKYTDSYFYKLDPIPKNLMFVRFRTNMWNLDILDEAVEHYTHRQVPVVLTFMAYYTEKVTLKYRAHYTFRQRTLNSYYAITTKAWESVMEKYKYNHFVYSCGKTEGEKGITSCSRCGNCLREYFNTMERLT